MAIELPRELVRLHIAGDHEHLGPHTTDIAIFKDIVDQCFGLLCRGIKL